MRVQRILSIVVLAVLAVGGAAACGGQSARDARVARVAGQSGDIVIGGAWPWEARQAALYAQGMDLAVDEVNAAGGIRGRRLRIQREDDHESVDGGRLVAQRLAANPDVVAVIGHMQSYVTLPAAAIYEQAGLVLIAPASTDPALTRQGYQHVFRAIFTDTQVGGDGGDAAAQATGAW